MVITRSTVVKEAVESSPAAPQIFARHGVNPKEKCAGMYDLVTLEEAEQRCHLHDLDGLIEELNAAVEAERAGHSTPRAQANP